MQRLAFENDSQHIIERLIADVQGNGFGLCNRFGAVHKAVG